MTAEPRGPSHHPAPSGDTLSTARAAFLLFTGPLAWFAQLCIGYGLLSWACFPYDIRLGQPLTGFEGTLEIALILLLICAGLASLSAWFAWRTLQGVGEESRGDRSRLIHVGHGRTRFTALWGLILSLGFAVATLLTLAGFALVPRCVG